MQNIEPSAGRATERDDAILLITRMVAAAVIPFLIAAFIILYLWPNETARLFAWPIASPLTTSIMGAGYLGGAYFFARLLFEKRWHRVGRGLPGVAALTAIMLAATLLHWDTFDPSHWPFLVWLVIYIVTPVLVPVVWWRNRRRDPGQPEPGEVLLPAAVSPVMNAVGFLLLASVAFLFFLPQMAIDIWPWPLTPLTARVLAGWQSLLAIGALAMARESRWSAWRIPMQSIMLWQGLAVLAFVGRRAAFGPAGPLNWYTLYTVAALVAAAAFYGWMESRRSANL